MDQNNITPAVQESWDAKADEWHLQVGEDGDANRRLNSDPVLWRMLGDVAGVTVLDAGCGTGYLAIKLAERGATVIGVDISPRMIELAGRRSRERGLDIEYHVGSVSELPAVADGGVDRIVSNYVLMDLPDLQATACAFHRVLRDGGHAVVIFSHPSFAPPNGGMGRMYDGSSIFRWSRSYFDEVQSTEEWGHFTTPFIAFHRPLSTYWKAFRAAGFQVLDFDEPIVPFPPPDGVEPAVALRQRMVPNSVAFLLGK